jgi:hypothetical protein
MTKQRELDLLIDITKLLKKYGRESFVSLAESLSSPEMNRHLSNILTQVAKTKETIPKKGRKTVATRRQLIPRVLVNLEKTEPEKYRLLNKFYNELITKAVLPSLDDVKEFARESGFPEVRAKSRQKAISPLLGWLAGFSYDELTVKIQSASKYRTGDRSLEGWSNIILDKKKDK